MKGYLLVRAGGNRYGLKLDQVLEVVENFEVSAAPTVHASVRGVAQMRNRSVPLVNLAALIANDAVPSGDSDTAVLTQCLGSLVAFEVDDAEAVATVEPIAVPDAWRLPWVCGVVKTEGELVPVIDIDLIGDRLVPTGAREQV